LCDEFDTSSVARVNDTAPASSYRDGMATAKEEVMKVKGSRRLVKRLGLALAVAAVAAPAAQAVPSGMTRAGTTATLERRWTAMPGAISAKRANSR